jgi:hypothetical protein
MKKPIVSVETFFDYCARIFAIDDAWRKGSIPQLPHPLIGIKANKDPECKSIKKTGLQLFLFRTGIYETTTFGLA